MNSQTCVHVRTCSIAAAALLVAFGATAQPVAAPALAQSAAAAPLFSPGWGVWRTPQSISISDATPGSRIYYTTNNTTPTIASTAYTGAITVSASETLRAIAVATGYTRSSVAIAIYRIVPLTAKPVFTPAAGVYRAVQYVAISDATPGAAIYYTTDGTTPTTASTRYTSAVMVGTVVALKAIAVAARDSQSVTASAQYSFILSAQLPPLAFAPAAGLYVGPQSVSISDVGFPGTKYYYTTDGTTPTIQSTEYTGAIAVNGTEILQAFAIAADRSQSSVMIAPYTIAQPGSTESILVNLIYNPGNSRPRYPEAGVIQGSDGNFYGTSSYGGAYDMGTVFRITAPNVVTVLYSFRGGSINGSSPAATLLEASDGNFYGVDGGGLYGKGAVLKITPTGVVTVFYSFRGGSGTGADGAGPNALIQASNGNFYGTCNSGGTNGGGTVFSITPGGVETVLHSFIGGVTDGAFPQAALVLGNDGNFYGTTHSGGALSWGTIFKITPAGVETVLHSFDYYLFDGHEVVAPLMQASDGNLYGTSWSGGVYGSGTVFKITLTDVETVLYSFTHHIPGSADGQAPNTPLIEGRDGNFYGATNTGGAYGNGSGAAATGYGTVFRVTPAGVETLVHSMGGVDSDGIWPVGLIQGSDGNLYGTAFSDRLTFSGVIFKVTP